MKSEHATTLTVQANVVETAIPNNFEEKTENDTASVRPPFTFVATTFVQPGYERAEGEWSEDTRKELVALRAFYPELENWGDLALGLAFGEFSQDVFLVNWADWEFENRDESFLNYCCWRQCRGAWKVGLDLDRLATAGDWKVLPVSPSIK